MATKIVNGRRVTLTPEQEFDFEQARTPRLADAIRELKRAIRERRKRAEEAGVTVGQYTIDTSLEFRQRLLELRDIAANAGPGERIPVVLANGSVVRVPGAALTQAQQAIAGHVRACLDVEADKLAEADALATVQAVRNYDVDAGWPS